MSVQEMMDYQKNATVEENMKLQIAFHCAPVLKGIKIANIIMVSKEEYTEIHRVLAGTKLSFCFLKEKEHKVLLFLYRKESLEGYLHTKDIRAFLKSLGYEQDGIEAMLFHLSQRIVFGPNGKSDFPHEIGLFLGYPLSDVIGFLQDEGDDCLYVGYWRVYDHLGSKLRLFQRYDLAREEVVGQILQGKSIREVAV